MNLIEAVQSGRAFKRKKSPFFIKLDPEIGMTWSFDCWDVLADDYELEAVPEQKIEVTKKMLREGVRAAYRYSHEIDPNHLMFDALCRYLGFKEEE